MFLSVHDQTAVLFRPKRHRFTAADSRQTRTKAHGIWVGYVGEIVAQCYRASSLSKRWETT